MITVSVVTKRERGCAVNMRRGEAKAEEEEKEKETEEEEEEEARSYLVSLIHSLSLSLHVPKGRFQ